MPISPPDVTAYLANSLLPDLGLQLDEDWRQGWLSRSALRSAAATLLDLLDTHDVPNRDQIVRGAEVALAVAGAGRADLSDEHIAAVGLMAYADALLVACRDRRLDEDEIAGAVVREVNSHVAEFLDGRRRLPPLN